MEPIGSVTVVGPEPSTEEVLGAMLSIFMLEVAAPERLEIVLNKHYSPDWEDEYVVELYEGDALA